MWVQQPRTLALAPTSPAAALVSPHRWAARPPSQALRGQLGLEPGSHRRPMQLKLGLEPVHPAAQQAIAVLCSIASVAPPVVLSCGVYIAPEIYRNEPFDRSVDVFAFGLILYEMIEGTAAFHPKPSEEAVKIICLEGLRPQFKNKPKYYPGDVKELIQECWDWTPSVRPTFAEIIVRLNKIHATCAKQTSWRDTFKLPWKHASEK